VTNNRRKGQRAMQNSEPKTLMGSRERHITFFAFWILLRIRRGCAVLPQQTLFVSSVVEVLAVPSAVGSHRKSP